MNIRILCIGDVVGITGRTMFAKHIDAIRKEHRIDATIVNGENSADDGRGITQRVMQFFKQYHVDVVTSGNHIYDKKDIFPYLAENRDLLRPANFPSDNPGVGVSLFTCKSVTIAVINVQGRVFMKQDLDCPFRTVTSLLTYLRDKTKIIVVDFHAETTSEKAGLVYYLEGKVSAVVGTHTHVQTADERILPGGTATITDLGMVGSLNSMIGMKKESIILNFLTQMPAKFYVETEGPGLLNGVIIEIEVTSGRAVMIERIRIVDPELKVESVDDK